MVVFDSSVVLAVLHNEPGASAVLSYLPDALLSAVNAAEVATKLAEKGMDEQGVHRSIQEFKLTITPFDSEAAYSAGLLRPHTRAFGLSLGDRACLALAMKERVPAITMDRAWQTLNIGVEIRVIR
jgi:PIN domain nuclease of toxin-antitoxin system